jgi:hypothetical protein
MLAAVALPNNIGATARGRVLTLAPVIQVFIAIRKD